jgi:hypothetical protein
VESVGFLRALDTISPPRLVITDGANELGNAVRRAWPTHPSPSSPVEHHLRENVGEALAADRVDHWGSARMTLLNDAFRGPGGWAEFCPSVWPKLVNSRAWVTANVDLVTTQVGGRYLLPDHHSTAALDAHLVPFVTSCTPVRSRRTTHGTPPRCWVWSASTSTAWTTPAATPSSCLDAKGGVAPGARWIRHRASVRLPWAERQPASLRH